MKKKRTLIYAAAIIAALLTGCKNTPEAEEEKAYSVMTVKTSSVEQTDKYSATIRGRQDVEIYPQITGKITRLLVTEGQHVSRGQTLFIIDQRPYRAALQTAEANLNAARTGVATASLNHSGKKELYDNKVTSAFELQKSANALRLSEAQRQQAEAQVVAARNDLSYTVVKSPCDGVVGTLPYRVGALVSPPQTTPLTTVSDNSVMYVYFSIPENSLISLLRSYGSTNRALEAMPPVSLQLNDGSTYGQKGRIESISGVIDQQTGSVSLRAAFPNPKGLLRSGGAGVIGIMNRKDNVLTIPQSATYELQDKVFCYRLIGGKTSETKIKVHALDDNKTYVVDNGLKAGDVIVTDGVSLLQDGEKIKVKK